MTNLLISSMGLITAVGRDAVTTAASIRAGISRPDELKDYKILDEGEYEMVPLTGYPIRGITEGMSAQARWLTLLSLAFEELVESGNLPTEKDKDFWEKTGLILVTPILDGMRFMFNPECQSEAIEENFLPLLFDELDYPFLQNNYQIISIDNPGALEALSDLENWLGANSLDRTVILGVDSWLDSVSLDYLGERERLKSESTPRGLMPGEAAGALLVETALALSKRKVKALAEVVSVSIQLEKKSFFSGEKSSGRAISKAIREVLEFKEKKGSFSGEIYLDLNGESWRANDYAFSKTQIPPRLIEEYSEVIPANSVGDTGAASALISIILATRSFERGYSKSNESLIISSSPSGEMGALLIKRSEDE